MTIEEPSPPPEINEEFSSRDSLSEIALLFLRLGFTAFGGPAAHIAMMRDEVVQRRKWMDDQQFLDLIGATNLIPGPNSTEMAIHTGFIRGGTIGLILAGSAFILPAMIIVLVLASIYVRYGTTPAAEALLFGIKPIVIVIIAHALIGLGQKAVKGALTGVVGLATIGLLFIAINPIALLIAGGLIVMLLQNLSKLRDIDHLGGYVAFIAPATYFVINGPVNLPVLFLNFLKIGSILYGSGYVLLAFLRADFVNRLGWLTDQQLIDAVAIGQVTPGPVFTTATFIGYVLAGLPGALLGTLGIFLPSFIFVAISNPLIPKLRQSVWAGSFLDGVNTASLGLMAAVTWQLGREAIVDPITIIIAALAGFLLVRYKVNSTWLILGGAITGLATFMFS